MKVFPLLSALLFVAAWQNAEVSGFKVVAFGSGTWDVAHISFVRESQTFFPSLAERKGFDFEYTNNWGNLNDDFLSTVDVVIFLDDSPSSGTQRSALERYARGGGGFLACHVSAFTTSSSDWAWYFNEFLGSGNFKSNTWGPTAVTFRNEAPDHGVTHNMPEKFTSVVSEWYSWTNNLRNNPNIDVLLSISEESFPVGTDPNQSWYSGDYPLVWSNNQYNMVYMNMGHNDIDYSNGNADLSRTWDNDLQIQLVTDMIYYMAFRRQAIREERQRFQKKLFGLKN